MVYLVSPSGARSNNVTKLTRAPNFFASDTPLTNKIYK